MVHLSRAFGLLLTFATVVHSVQGRRSNRSGHARRQAAITKRHERLHSVRSTQNSAVKNITFANARASEFYVDGTSIPEVDFDIGPSWSGLIPISNRTDETRKLFFWFFPPGPEGSLDDLIFWTNGGPGCSSLEGLLQENGPFTWPYGQAKPAQNQYSWTNLSSVLYVEQPAGVGFSQGDPALENEEQLAVQLVGFFQQFLEVFKELKGKNFYVTGESYAGQYVPYIANHIYNNPGTLDLKLQGIWMADPLISYHIVQSQIPALDFVKYHSSVFALPNTTMAILEETARKCNYTDYISTYATYPPKGPLPFPQGTIEPTEECDIWDTIFYAAYELNPAFNEYRIYDMYPVLWDVLGYPGSYGQVQVSPLYFDREDVKRAIHAPLNTTWTECIEGEVFPDGKDGSPPSSFGALSETIEKSKRAVIVNGLADFDLIAAGTRIAIQNMTWDGKQGFQMPIEEKNFLVDGISLPTGNKHEERGLTYVEVALSGHMVPQFSPWSAFQTMEFLLGQREAV